MRFGFFLLLDADGIATAQVLIVTPSLSYDVLRDGTDASVGPAVDIEVLGASPAHTSADGNILGMEVSRHVVQVAYLPGSGGSADAPAQLVQLAEIAASRI